MMKTLERTLMLFVWLSLAGWLWGADVKLTWDPNDPSEALTKYTLYEKVGSNYQKIADITAPTVTYVITNVVPGRHVYVCTASNSWGESGYSNEAVTPNLNQPPKNLTWQVIVTVGP